MSDSKDDKSKEINGIPENLKIKRPYTLSPKAIEQRRRNARKASEVMQKNGLSTGPKTKEGKEASSRNSWKHGQSAASMVLRHRKPCKSTCHQYPCSVVEDGKAKPGGDCMDKEMLIETWNAILSAVKNGEYDDFNAMSAMLLAKNIHIISDIQEAILADGVTVLLGKIDKDGNPIVEDIKLHPGLLALSKLTEALGLTSRDMMITPKEISRSGVVEDGVKTISDMLLTIGNPKKKND